MLSADPESVKAWLIAQGLGALFGRLLFALSWIAALCMTAGLFATVALFMTFGLLLTHTVWNSLPLSATHATLQVIVFGLMWSDSGAVWSVDRWLAGRRRGVPSESSAHDVIAPLRLIRFQVALIYLTSGVWKLHDVHWRDGTALHYVLNSNLFRRFPSVPSAGLEPYLSILTYVTLCWELGFAFMLLYAPTRRVALMLGVVLHVGMLMTIEVGTFAWIMLAAYVSFLDPDSLSAWARRPSTGVSPKEGSVTYV
jgi:hypothetical protein